VATSVDLSEATLTAASPAGTRSLDILREVIAPGGGSFSPRSIGNVLLPGTNTVTVVARNCAGAATASATVIYSPLMEGTRYELLGLEVTQTIQDLGNRVPLIAGKRTFVRVYLRTTGGTDVIHSVSGALQVCHDVAAVSPACLSGDSAFTRLPSLNAITVNDAADPTEKRRQIDAGLLFELPSDWTNAGQLYIALDDLVLSPGRPCDNCDIFTPEWQLQRSV
jgi:hypothetical protein